jgi:hypothetical protein
MAAQRRSTNRLPASSLETQHVADKGPIKTGLGQSRFRAALEALGEVIRGAFEAIAAQSGEALSLRLAKSPLDECAMMNYDIRHCSPALTS